MVDGDTRWWHLKCFLEFSPLNLAKMFPQVDDDFFQMGWFNHQVGYFLGMRASEDVTPVTLGS